MATKGIMNHSFWQQPAGYFLTAVVLWIVGYILFSLAVDSGSILQWVGTLVAVIWGLGRFLQGVKRLIRRNGSKR
jgi:uncharacterized membrane protein